MGREEQPLNGRSGTGTTRTRTGGFRMARRTRHVIGRWEVTEASQITPADQQRPYHDAQPQLVRAAAWIILHARCNPTASDIYALRRAYPLATTAPPAGDDDDDDDDDVRARVRVQVQAQVQGAGRRAVAGGPSGWCICPRSSSRWEPWRTIASHRAPSSKHPARYLWSAQACAAASPPSRRDLQLSKLRRSAVTLALIARPRPSLLDSQHALHHEQCYAVHLSARTSHTMPCHSMPCCCCCCCCACPSQADPTFLAAATQTFQNPPTIHSDTGAARTALRPSACQSTRWNQNPSCLSTLDDGCSSLSLACRLTATRGYTRAYFWTAQGHGSTVYTACLPLQTSHTHVWCPMLGMPCFPTCFACNRIRAVKISSLDPEKN